MKSFTEKNSDRHLLGDILPLKMPLGLCIEPTNICNFKCIQCPVSLPHFRQTVGELGHMDMALYRKVLRDIAAMGKLKNLNLYGDGEPLANPNIVEMIKTARDMDVADLITVTTNGSLLTEDLARDLLSSGLTYLRVSIYALDDDELLRITSTNTKTSHIYDNLATFRAMRDKTGQQTPFLYVKMLDTYSDANDRFKQLYQPIADQTNIETPMNWNGYEGLDLISKVDSEGKTDQTKIQGFYEESGKSGVKRCCTTAFHSLNIKRNGDVTICIVDWNKGTMVGNIEEESLSQIWYGQRLTDFRRMQIEDRRHENVSCKHCNYLFCNPDNIDSLSQERYHEILNFRG